LALDIAKDLAESLGDSTPDLKGITKAFASTTANQLVKAFGKAKLGEDCMEAVEAAMTDIAIEAMPMIAKGVAAAKQVRQLQKFQMCETNRRTGQEIFRDPDLSDWPEWLKKLVFDGKLKCNQNQMTLEMAQKAAEAVVSEIRTSVASCKL